MGKWFSKLTNDIINISSAITASIVCSFIVFKLVNSDVIYRTEVWNESEGDIECASGDTTCTVTCAGNSYSCGSEYNGLGTGPAIICPTTNDCTECNIICTEKQACSGSIIYGNNCSNLNVTVDQRDNYYMSIYAPDNGGSLFVQVTDVGRMKSYGEIYGATNTNNIIIDCSKEQFRDMIVNASNIKGVLEFYSSDSCSSRDSTFYCPTSSACTLEFGGSGINSDMMITGTHLMEYTCPALNCDATLACLDSTVVCDECGTGDECCTGYCVAPTSNPSFVPSMQPTTKPSSKPTIAPSSPTSNPITVPPTSNPITIAPTFDSISPTSDPSSVSPTAYPISAGPTSIPITASPTSDPITAAPAIYPSSNPTLNPNNSPSTTSPSLLPSSNPATNNPAFPSANPTNIPSSNPVTNDPTSPSANPTNIPSSNPITNNPTSPSTIPTNQPTNIPSSDPVTSNPTLPSTNPTNHPSFAPTSIPTYLPSNNPSIQPSFYPSIFPTNDPTHYPTIYPSNNPSIFPTNFPTLNPSNSPTYLPSYDPTYNPTVHPTEFIPTEDPSADTSGLSNSGSKASSTTIIIASVSLSIFFFIVFLIVSYFYRKNKQLKKYKVTAGLQMARMESDMNAMKNVVTPGVNLQQNTISGGLTVEHKEDDDDEDEIIFTEKRTEGEIQEVNVIFSDEGN